VATLYTEIFDLAMFDLKSYELDTLYSNSVTTCPIGITYYSDVGLTTTVGVTTQAYTSIYVTGFYSSIVVGSTIRYVSTADCIASNYDEYMTGFLIRSISSFNKTCRQDLSDRNDVTMTFNIELTDDEKDILACLVAVQVLKQEVFDIRQIRGMIKNKDGERYSEANLLKEKMSLQDRLIELADKKKSEYDISNTDWDTFYDTD
jgi:hypothetical protein